MAYELYENPLDKASEILNRYNNKIAVLKCDVQCRCGIFRKGTVAYVRRIKFTQNERNIDIEMKIYDCSERNDLTDYEPYKTYDTFKISAASNEELTAVLYSLFDVNDEKTECQKKYNELMQKTRSYNIDETAANDYRTVFIILLVIAFVILITIDMLSDYDFSKDEVILTAIILLLYGIKIFLRFKKIHKTRCFEIIANELHKTIISD